MKEKQKPATAKQKGKKKMETKSVAVEASVAAEISKIAKAHGSTMSAVATKILYESLETLAVNDFEYAPAKPRGRKPGGKNKPKTEVAAKTPAAASEDTEEDLSHLYGEQEGVGLIENRT